MKIAFDRHVAGDRDAIAELKRARADHVIDNTGSIGDLERQVRALWASLQQDARARTAAVS